ncbi:glycosyltransferase family 2 protein [Candidatus Electronema sp. PJ]|uniref:glycosyltransferase family 2 protein n=1 Tax=Candidatus Electronema sp. PJ TaxID=3401572 RepID=UPI003AA89C43
MKKKIIGISLVRNEDLFLEKVLENIFEFCDEIIVADNLSDDQTYCKVQRLQKKYRKIHSYSISSPALSHDLVSNYARTDTWIFAVDGDELYDPAGLRRLRQRLFSGEYNSWWIILGNALHCIDLNIATGYVQGYLSPPCRSMTKLYNFNAINTWSGPCPERLHGGTIQFRQGYDESLRLELYKTTAWDEADFRCLHLCFIRRSSLEKEHKISVRKNISDMNSEGIFARIKALYFRLAGIEQQSSWKRERYMRGQLVEKSARPFL